MAMKVERLKKLADYLRKVPESKFSLYTWCRSPNYVYDSPDCGTTACALGHAGLMPAFRKAGLKTEASENGGRVCLTPRGKRAASTSWNEKAGMEFFGLTHDEALYLFFPGHYPINERTAKDVAKRIKQMIKDGGLPKVADYLRWRCE